MKFCTFISLWIPVIATEIDLLNEGLKLKDNENTWKTLAQSTQLTKELEDMLKDPIERTLVSLQTNERYSQSFDYNIDAYHDGDYFKESAYFGTATAIYDFQGEEQSDLPFLTGDVINVTEEDDGSGWLTGEFNGKVGIFPASYVQRNY